MSNRDFRTDDRLVIEALSGLVNNLKAEIKAQDARIETLHEETSYLLAAAVELGVGDKLREFITRTHKISAWSISDNTEKDWTECIESMQGRD